MANRKIEGVSNDPNTIKWWKVECSFFKESFGVAHWSDLVEFMDHNVGFDYKITGMHSNEYEGVEGVYDSFDGMQRLDND